MRQKSMVLLHDKHLDMIWDRVLYALHCEQRLRSYIVDL